jgi:NADPH-dependent curcumin reductase CurA
VVVTAASGAVGSVVGQLAKAKGCRAVGVAGGAEKCRYVVEELGFDACVDYKAGKLKDDLKAALPRGVDCLFENVGGEIFDALLARTNAFARIALCGMIADYNTTLAAWWRRANCTTAKASPTDLRMRPRPSSACSRGAISASNWSSWSD